MKETIDKLNKATEETADAIRNVIGTEKFVCRVGSFGRSVIIEGTDNETNIYIRTCILAGKVVANFSNVYVDPSLQRTGILDSIVEQLKNLPCIQAIVVSSVISDSMHNFCKKHNFVEYPQLEWYILNK